MKLILQRSKTVLLGMLNLAVSIGVIPFAWLTPLFAKWDKEPTEGRIRGDLPKWLGWFSTPDERLPGGFYEPTVASMYDKHGKLLTAMYWVGWRNRAHGFRAYTEKPATEAQYLNWDKSKFVDYGDGLWKLTLGFGGFVFVTGYRIYKQPGEVYKAIPTFTIKRA